MDKNDNTMDKRVFNAFLLFPMVIQLIMSFIVTYALTRNTLVQSISASDLGNLTPTDYILTFFMGFSVSAFFMYLSYPLFSSLKEVIGEEFLDNEKLIKSTNYAIRSQIALLVLNLIMFGIGMQLKTGEKYVLILMSMICNIIFDVLYVKMRLSLDEVQKENSRLLWVFVFAFSLFFSAFLPSFKQKFAYFIFRLTVFSLFKEIFTNETLISGYLKRRVTYLLPLLVTNLNILVFMAVVFPQFVFNTNFSSGPFMIVKKSFEKLCMPQCFKVITSAL